MRERDNLEGQGVDGRIILKCYVSTNWIDLAKWGQVAGCCDCGNEPSCSI